MATRTVSALGGNWDSLTTWSEGAVPTAADEVVNDALSGNLTLNVNGACRSFDLSAKATTFTMNSGIDLAIGDATAPSSGYALRFHASTTLTVAGTGNEFQFVSTNSTQQDIDMKGKGFGQINFSGGTYNYRFVSAVTAAAPTNAGSAVAVNGNGEVHFNGQTFTVGAITGTAAGTRTLYLEGSTFALGATGTVWNTTATNLTIDAGTAAINITDAGATNKTLNLGGKNYTGSTMAITAGGAGIVDFAGATNNTLGSLTVNAPKSIRFRSGQTQTIAGNFTATGSSGNVITVTSSTAASAATLSKANGLVSCNWLSLQDSTVTGGALWYAGGNSTNVSGNTGWTFTAPATMLTADDSETDATSYATASITPTANTTLIAFIASKVSSGSPTLSSVTGNGLTWTEVRTVNSSTVRGLSVYRASGASPSAGAVTFDFGAQTQLGANWGVIQVDGTSTVTTDGVVQSSTGSDSADTLTVTLGAFAFSGNHTLGVFMSIDTAGGALNNSEGAGFTMLAENSGLVGGETFRSGVEYKTGSDTSVDMDAIAANDRLFGVAMEIALMAVPITGADIAISLTEDVDTITQDHVIATDDVAISLTTDNATIAQDHVISGADIAISLSEDNTTVEEESITISAADVAISLTEDAATISQNHIVSPDDITFSLAEDNDTIAQNHVIATNDIAISLGEDSSTVTETNFSLTAQDISISLGEDSTTISQNHVIAAQDVTIALGEDNDTITQDHVVVTQDIAVSLGTDSTTVDVIYTVVTQDVAVSTAVDSATIVQNHVIATQDVAISLGEDNTTVAETPLAPNDIQNSLLLDSTTITQNHVISTDDIAFSLASDNDTIAQNHILSPADLAISLAEDATTIEHILVFSPADITHSLRLDKGYAYDGTPPVERDYYVDSSGNIYWVVNETIGLVEKV